MILAAGLMGACAPTAPTPTLRAEPYVSGWPARANAPANDLGGRWTGEASFAGCRAVYGSCKDFPRPAAIELTVAQAASELTGAMRFMGQEYMFAGYITITSGVAGRALGDSGSFDVRFEHVGSALTGFIASGSFDDPNLRLTSRYNVTAPLRRLGE